MPFCTCLQAWWESSQSTVGELDLSCALPSAGWSPPSRQNAFDDFETSFSSSHQDAASPVEEHPGLDASIRSALKPPQTNPFIFTSPLIRVHAESDAESHATPASIRSLGKATKAVGASQVTEEERAIIAARQGGGRRRSVTFKIEAPGSYSPKQVGSARPSFLALGEEGPRRKSEPTNLGSANFLHVERLKREDPRRGSVSSRSSNASSVYGVPPAPYEFDHQRYSRRNSAEDVDGLEGPAEHLSTPTVDIEGLRKKFAENRKKSIDGDFKWHMAEFDFKPTSVECVNLSYQIREQQGVSQRVKTLCTNTLSCERQDLSADSDDDIRLLRNVNLKIDSGSLVGVLGPSG